MYKTVRHGENSLQYTILPQNDDFRIEGKLSSAGSNCSSTTGRKVKARRQRRRSFFAYLGLIFICTVIVGAVLIPFLVSAECLPNPTEWFLKTKAALTHGGNINALHRGSGGPRKAGANGIGSPQHVPLHNSVASIGQKVEIINRDGVEKIILRVNKTQTQSNLNVTQIRPIGYASDKEQQPPLDENNSTTNVETQTAVEAKSGALTTTTLGLSNDSLEDVHGSTNSTTVKQSSNGVGNFVTEVRFESDSIQSPKIVVITTQRTQLPQNVDQISSNANKAQDSNGNGVKNIPTAAIRPTTSFSTTSIYSPHAPAAASMAVAQSGNANAISNQSSTIPTITTRIMQLPLLKSIAKKPIIPPVLVRTNSEITTLNQNSNKTATEDGGIVRGDGIATGSIGTGGLEPIKAEVADNAETKNAAWIQSHWPYIDPSTYFQWTGYKEDSVLLPALLGFALIGMILIIAICLIARNKRAIVSSMRKRKRNDVEEAGADDNTTLLTNANLSDED
ncbi:uncharacterized protein LOC105212716 [Zeugodacus cucurbitae]|uniref:Uncharacterized protein n=1 Tax=Zeugodacus cucurbitae TaxID=28588 RepID=A0A0A1WVU0_ZEUCU|nr:uncharacterized protein LOC105212716 [Zeugodacus cucurbitae]XP_054088484.1 uncharacterized protein LOC105212716 [Zeugodacus cucurbitae]